MSTPEETVPPPKKRRRLHWTLAQIGGAFLLLVAALAVGVRYGVLVPQVRSAIEAELDGLSLGRIGRLGVSGLSGDIWRDLRVKRLTIRDGKGVWLEASDVRLAWDPAYLLRRRFVADIVVARHIRVLRRPTLGPSGEDHGMPVSVNIARGQTRLVLEPAFSVERGVYDVGLELNLSRRGRRSAQLHAESALNPGDRVDIDFAMGGRRPLRVAADAVEARGGAIAGSLGLPARQPFRLYVRADGRNAQGQFTAYATSGATTPITTQGAWDRQGGQAGGRIRLTASTLTAPYADRFGHELRFGLAGRKTRDGLFALDGRAYSDAFKLHVWGPGDLGKRRLGPAGLRVDAEAASLSRLVGEGKLGAIRVGGVFHGDDRAWRLTAETSVEAVGVGDYGLRRVSGPVELRRAKDVYDLDATLTGEGGAGTGIVAALFGGAPHVTFKAQRLAGGKLLLRQLDFLGRGLTVQATGARSLLGALNVEGKAQISNLAAARPGATGGASVSWRLSQSRDRAPWQVDLDARGESLALGFAELDRLLGPQPRFKLDAAWQDNRLTVAEARLDGQALNATASGAMQPDRALAFKTDWRASGPIRAGPVEITGRARGSGAVAGTLDAPRLDLVADFDAIDLPRVPLKNGHLTLTFQRRPDGSAGAVAITAASDYGPARARSDFRFPAGGVDLTGLSMDAGGIKADGALSLRRNSPSAADLRVEITRGALLEGGRAGGTLRIVAAPGGARATVALTAENAWPVGAPFRVRSAQISADGPLASLPYTIDAEGDSDQGGWAIDGRGKAAEDNPGYGLTFEGSGRFGKRLVKTTEPASFHLGGPSRSARLRLVSGEGGVIALDAAFKGESANVQAKVAGLGLDLLDRDLAGRFDADLDLRGAGARLTGELEARVAQARAGGMPAAQGVSGTMRARLDGDVLALNLQTANQQGLNAHADVTLPVETSAAPFRVAVARKRPIRGQFFAEGEIRPLFALLVGGDRSLAGAVRAQGTLGGTLADPQANGEVSVENGRFEDGASGLSLRALSLKATFNGDAIRVGEAQGQDGRGGRLDGAGTISLQRDGVSSFRLDLKSFRLIDNETAVASATGQATINRDADGRVKLAGDLLIDNATVAADPPTPSGVVAMDVIEVNRPAGLPAALPPKEKRGEGWALDVKLHAPRRVFLRGRGLDVEFSLDAHVGGTTTNTDLTGTARVVRGDYDFAGKRFEFDDSGVVQLSTRPEAIRLQLDAVRDDPTLTVTVRIRGTAARPEITLASSPSLPNDEILSKMLFERSASQLSAVEAAQLASTLSSLAGGGGLDVIGNLRSFAGLDRLAFGGDQTSGVTVSGGKYLTDDVYLELTGGGREGPSAQVEWRVRKHLSLLSRFAGQAGNRIAVRWRKDY